MSKGQPEQKKSPDWPGFLSLARGEVREGVNHSRAVPHELDKSFEQLFTLFTLSPAEEEKFL